MYLCFLWWTLTQANKNESYCSSTPPVSCPRNSQYPLHSIQENASTAPESSPEGRPTLRQVGMLLSLGVSDRLAMGRWELWIRAWSRWWSRRFPSICWVGCHRCAATYQVCEWLPPDWHTISWYNYPVIESYRQSVRLRRARDIRPSLLADNAWKREV